MYSWIKTHKELSVYLLKNKKNQTGLIQLLQQAGIYNCFKDHYPNKGTEIELDEIDPFTFTSCIYTYGDKRKLEHIQKIASILGITSPTDVAGIPSGNGESTWLFPYKYQRTNKEIERLWKFFSSVLDDKVTDKNFADILNINSVGKAKLTEGLYRVFPEKYFPIDRNTIYYLDKEYHISSDFNTYTEYQNILKQIGEKTDKPFYEIVHQAIQANIIKYWVFQGSTEMYDIQKALSNDTLKDWTVTAHREKIKIGDKVILWMTGNNPGCYALAEITTEPLETSEGDWKAGIMITHNLSHKPIKKEKISRNKKLINLQKIGVQDSDFRVSKVEYMTLLDIVQSKEYGLYDHTLNNSTMEYPINTIFYGPPGTGKTYTTLIRAAEIIEQRVITKYRDAQQIFNQHLGDRIEFITFHQNYSYEDFIQGLRPDVENEGNLSFERKDGVFKRIADRALRNLELSEKSSEDISEDVRFDTAVQSLTDEIQDSDNVYPLNKSVNIIGVDGDAFRYIFKEGNQNINGLRMKFSDLKEMYRNHVKERQDIKKLTTISGLAIQHASYFLMVYNKILKHLPTKEPTVSPVQKQNYVIIIDEINRANISRVFGELITLIEKDKRSHGSIPLRCTLPSGESFIVPSNLYIIGTMNTADKSIALLDIALRRRFDFEAMYPQSVVDGKEVYNRPIFEKINARIKELKGHDFQIGHAYFMGENSDIVECMNKKVIPLLLEYFMNDEKEVRGILSSTGLTVEENSWPLKITR